MNSSIISAPQQMPAMDKHAIIADAVSKLSATIVFPTVDELNSMDDPNCLCICGDSEGEDEA